MESDFCVACGGPALPKSRAGDARLGHYLHRRLVGLKYTLHTCRDYILVYIAHLCWNILVCVATMFR